MAAHAAGFLSVFFVATEMWQLPVVQSFRQRLLQPAWRINHNSDSRGLIKFLPASNQCFSAMSWWNFARPLITAGSCQSRDEDWVFSPVNQADCWGKAEFVRVVTVTNIRPVEVMWCKHNPWKYIICYDIWPKAKIISLASLTRVGMCAALVGWHGGECLTKNTKMRESFIDRK